MEKKLENLLKSCLLCILLTGCYTRVTLQYTASSENNITVVSSKKDTLKTTYDKFLLLYNSNPRYYDDWRIYYNNKWIPPYRYHLYNKPLFVNYYYKIEQVYTPLKQEDNSKKRTTGISKSETSSTRSNNSTQRDKSTATPRSRNN